MVSDDWLGIWATPDFTRLHIQHTTGKLVPRPDTTSSSFSFSFAVVCRDTNVFAIWKKQKQKSHHPSYNLFLLPSTPIRAYFLRIV